MNKFLIIFKQEYAQIVKKKSFIFGLLFTPLLLGAFSILPGLLASKKATETEKLAIIDQSGLGLGAKFSESLKPYKLDDSVTPYYGVTKVYEIPANDSAQYKAVSDSLVYGINEKEIKYVMVFGPSPQIHDSSCFLITNAESFRSINRFEKKVSDLLASIRLTEANVNIPIDSVLNMTRQPDLLTKTATGETISFTAKYFSSFAFIMIMYMMIIGYGMLVMRSIIEEKNSRIMEVLVSSVTPFQLMLGKITGLGAATLTQVGIWVFVGLGITTMSGSYMQDVAIQKIVFHPAILTFFLLFLISGYFLYSTFYALIGSIVNEEKEAQNFMFPIIISLMLPFMLMTHVVQEPNSTMSTVLSLIPIFTPTLMLMRLIFVVPTSTDLSPFSGIIGEAILGVVIVTLTTIALVWVTAKIFRVGILMYGKRPTLPEILKWVKQ
jgi:ABC-2 type transport system permease protein